MTSKVSESTPQRRPALRDPRQRFDPEAEFVWRKRVQLEEGFSTVDGPVDKSAFKPTQIRNLWEAQRIELSTEVSPEKHNLATDSFLEVDLSVTGRGCYRLVLIGDDGIEEEYKARGLGNLLTRATALGVRERVLALLSEMKAAEATPKTPEPGPPQAAPQEPETVDDEGEAGDDSTDSDPSSPTDFGEGESGAPDGGGGPEGSVVSADSTSPEADLKVETAEE